MPLKNCLAVTQQVTDLCIACVFYIKPPGWMSTRSSCAHTTQRMCLAITHSCERILFLIFFVSFSFFYVTALSFIGPPGQLDSSVSCTIETKWNRGRAVMSNSSYSVTYRPAAVWGSLLETMEGFERSGALWSPSLIEFPGTGLQCWGWLWSGSCGFREGVRTLLCADLSQTQVGWSGRG